jgi:hypothetical protein
METNTQIQTQNTEIVNVEAANSTLGKMMVFIKDNLQKGTDYMSIQGGKPTLLKSGAEKMNILMRYKARYEKTNEVMNPKDCYYYVEVKCTLIDKDNNVVAECIASCNNKEKAREKIGFYDSLNPVLKVAEKRAYVGATLNANALSQFYTQDLEDTNIEPERKKVKPLTYECEGCHKKDIPKKVAEYSSDKYGKILCMECQNVVRNDKK